MSKKRFIRAIWGIYDNSHKIIQRRQKVDLDIQRIIKSPYTEPFRTYVLGQDNYNRLIKMGVTDCVLVDKRPYLFDLIKHQYRHKMELIRYAMEEDGIDELVYMDWDCVPRKKLPKGFWQTLRGKDVFQATLQMYHRKKCMWRKESVRKVPNGGFIYLRDKSLPTYAISLWENLEKPDNDEPAWAKMTDNMMGGFHMDEYWNRFEPMVCNLHRSSPYSQELLKTKNECFIHYQG